LHADRAQIPPGERKEKKAGKRKKKGSELDIKVTARNNTQFVDAIPLVLEKRRQCWVAKHCGSDIRHTTALGFAGPTQFRLRFAIQHIGFFFFFFSFSFSFSFLRIPGIVPWIGTSQKKKICAVSAPR